MDLLLRRDIVDPPVTDYTYGNLGVYARTGMLMLTLQTIERPWIPDPRGEPCGHPDTSCVPVGTYVLALHDTPDHPRTWALVNAQLGIYATPSDIPAEACGRSECLIHNGNVASQSMGCILVGLTRSLLNGVPDVSDSRRALARLQMLLPWVAGHTLTIE